MLRQLNPRLTESAAETMGYLRTDNDYLNAQAAAACQNARWAEDDLVIEPGTSPSSRRLSPPVRCAACWR